MLVDQFKSRQKEIRAALPGLLKHFAGTMQAADYLQASGTGEEIVDIVGLAIAMGGGLLYTYAAFVVECLDTSEQGEA